MKIKEKLNCRGTHAVSGHKIALGLVELRDHEIAGQPPVKCITSILMDKAEDETAAEELAEDVAAGKPWKDCWRRSFRNVEPEKSDPAINKLMNSFKAHVGAALNKIEFACRRRSRASKEAAFQQEREAHRVAAWATRAAVKAKQLSSSPSSSTNTSTTISLSSGSSCSS